MKSMRFFRGVATLIPANRWTVLIGGFLLNLMLGIVYAWSVFVRPLMDSYGWSKTTATLPFTVFLIVFALMMIPAGRAQDKKGPRKIATIGGILLGAGFLLSQFIGDIQNPVLLCVTYGLIAGAGCGLGYACPIPTIRKWFPDKPGLSVGLVVMGFGLSALIFAPLQHHLIDTYGISTTFWIIGLVLLVIAVLAASLLKNPPEGWKPTGWSPPQKSDTSVATGPREYTQKEVVKTGQFWLTWVIFVFMAAAGLMVIGHVAAYAEEIGLIAATAAIATGVLSVFNAGGRPGSGFFSDKIGVIKTMLILFAVQGIMMLVFPHFATTTATLFVTVAIVGFCFGANFAIFPSITADSFGIKNMGANYGLVFTAYGVGGILGPLMGSRIYDATQSYATAFTVAAVLVFVAVGLTWLLKTKYFSSKKQA